jgi:hypothetical protein
LYGGNNGSGTTGSFELENARVAGVQNNGNYYEKVTGTDTFLISDTEHEHTLSGGISNSADPTQTFDNRTSYYALIYIIKVTDAGKSE